MEKDPIVAEVRRIRHQIAKECGYDLEKIIEHANEAVRSFHARCALWNNAVQGKPFEKIKVGI